MDITAIAKEFTGFYYQTFASGRQNLTPLYVSTPLHRAPLSGI